MEVENNGSTVLRERALGGNEGALADLFTRYRSRLLTAIRVRMHPRLQGRVDPADVLQEAWLDVAKRYPGYIENPEMPVHIWLRFLAVQKLAELHRRHLGAQRRDAGREVRLRAGPSASSVCMADHLAGSVTSPSRGAARGEVHARLVEALDGMDPVDREILVLRHFEEMTNNEAAEVLGLTKAGASNRYVRALKRLKGVLSGDATLFGGEA